MLNNSGFLRHFQACNQRDLAKFVPFFINEEQFGWIRKDLVSFLSQNDSFRPRQEGLELHPRYNSFDSRTEALHIASNAIAEKYETGLRKELYPIVKNWGDEPLAQIDRAAVPWFGVKGFGIHVNGFVRKADGIYLWIGERATDRLVDPGKLDNMIGGGQPIGLTLEQNLCKEAEEEAGLAPALAVTARKIHSLAYLLERHRGLRNDVLFIFDLELPEDVYPRNTDGEVAAFHLMPAVEVARLVNNTNRFKFNCNLVIIDFLIRHGFITPDHPEYQQLRNYIEKPAIA